MIRTLTIAATLALTTIAIGSPPSAAPDRPDRLADGPLEPLNYFVGDWIVDAQWAWGDTLKGRNEYRVGLQGKFLEVATIVQDNDGPVYERYYSFFTYDASDKSFVAMGLNFDGSTSSLPYSLEASDGLPAMEFNSRNPDGSSLRQRIQATDQDNYSWKVWMKAPGGSAEQQIMDGTWKRVTRDDPWASAGTAPMSGPHDIDSDKFVSSGADVRSFTKTVEIDAPTGDVFSAWSSAEGWMSVYASPQSVANIDLAVGGRYEWLFNGSLGSNGCQVLSYIPDRMISFTWNAPPSQAENRMKRTWVVVELTELDSGATRVDLTHLGFGEGEQWDQSMAYFQSAWGRVLGAMQEKMSSD